MLQFHRYIKYFIFKHTNLRWFKKIPKYLFHYFTYIFYLQNWIRYSSPRALQVFLKYRWTSVNDYKRSFENYLISRLSLDHGNALHKLYILKSLVLIFHKFTFLENWIISPFGALAIVYKQLNIDYYYTLLFK